MTLGPRRRPDLDDLPTYSSARPGTVPVRIRASSNEAPGPAPEELVLAATAALREAGRYPRLHGMDLVEAIAARERIVADQVAVGDGSLSLLDRLLAAYLRPGRSVVTAWRSYEAYPLSIRIAGGRPVQVPLTRGGDHDLDRMAAAVDQETVAVIVCNPNNPTGGTLPWPRVEAFLDRLPDGVLAVLDEAYVEYAEAATADRPAPAALLRRPNLAMLRTFSKAHAMAGLRAGYLMADAAIIGAVRAVSPPFPVSTPAVAAAVCSLAHPEWVRDRVRAARAERDRITALLRGRGLPVLPSQANFVWSPLGEDSRRFAALAADAGVLVRPFGDEGVRITVGDPRLAEALEPVLRRWEQR